MKLHGWGRYPVIEAETPTFESAAEAARLLSTPGYWIARGLGKSYGDSAVNHQVLMTRRLNKFLHFDEQAGVVTCESGVVLAELIDVFLPKGWFPEVVPGTKLITVGGAIASDVHGKNHHTTGCFSSSILSLKLLLPDNTILTCGPDQNQELFRATCGGMGLTGVILEAAIRLQPVRSARIKETVIRCANLAEAIDKFERHQASPYSVAWIDCLAKGDLLGRSVLMVGDHEDDGPLELPGAKPVAVPIDSPSFLLNPYSVSLFNHLYFHTRPSRMQNKVTSVDAFFFPLDRISGWNRMYGRHGFTQYQFVLPKQASLTGLKTILTRIAQSGIGSFLATLKLFGPENDNYLSFPMEGYTLALDFKIQPKLFALLDELDRMVIDHGGRLYLTKDVRMQPDIFKKGYPRADAFAAVRATHHLSEKVQSLQSMRLGI